MAHDFMDLEQIAVRMLCFLLEQSSFYKFNLTLICGVLFQFYSFYCFLAFGLVFTDRYLLSYVIYIFGLLIIYRMNPQNEAAKKGLERLEKQMKVAFTLNFFMI